MPDTLTRIPLTAIDDAALPRDRTALDADALRELQTSIAVSGLRLPVELFPLDAPTPRYGILSGFRRVTAFRALHDLTGTDAYAAIPAFLRAPGDMATALAAMVEENEIRADLSPWERGRIALTARDLGLFPTIEEAVDRLYPAADKVKRSRLRALARLAEDLDGLLTAPESLSQRQALRLATACRAGFADLIATTLEETPLKDPASQWTAILPHLTESERFAAPDTPVETRGRPRRVLRPRPGLTIRREMTREGYVLKFSGREATSGLIDVVMDEIERMFSRNGTN